MVTDVNGNGMKMGEFKGRVLTTLENLKEGQEKQWLALETLNKTLNDHIKKSESKISVC